MKKNKLKKSELIGIYASIVGIKRVLEKTIGGKMKLKCGFCGLETYAGGTCDCNYSGNPYNPSTKKQEYVEVEPIFIKCKNCSHSLYKPLQDKSVLEFMEYLHLAGVECNCGCVNPEFEEK